MNTRSEIRDWLLEPDDVSVRYRTLYELLDHDLTDNEVRRAKAEISGSQRVGSLFKPLQSDGSWEYGYKHKPNGYLFFITASLSWAAELGLDRNDERVSRAVRYLFSLQHDDGDFYRHYSCLNGLILRTLNRLGFGDDPQAVQLRKLLLDSSRHDGGFHCDMRPRRTGDGSSHKSCIRGSIVALLAYSEDAELRRSEQSEELVEYFLKRHVFFRTDSLSKPVVERIMRLSFPFIYMPGILEAIYALATLGQGNRKEMEKAWSILESKRDRSGRLPLERTVVWPHIRVTARGRPCKWLTLYALLAKKARDTVPLETRKDR